MHLRGRAGRQGDPGEAKFFVSFDDELVGAVFGKGGKQLSLVRRMWTEGQPFDRLATSLTSAQAKQAANEATWLVQVREWDRVVADQQHLVYAERLAAVRGDDLSGQVRALIEEVVRAQVAAAAAEQIPAERFWGNLRELYPVSLTPQGGVMPRQELARIADLAVDDAQRAYDHRETELGLAATRDLERRVILVSLDRGWREHVQALPDLAKSIGIRASGQAALAEYRRDGAAMFNRMRSEVNRCIVGSLFYAQIEVDRLSEPASPG